MAKKYTAFNGMDDLLPGESEKWQWLESKAKAFFASRRLSEIRTPVLEQTELFVRSIGEVSDIVHKEMYTLEDRGGRSMTLRPEMTASVARAVIEHSLLRSGKEVGVYYTGPMFRAERPQAGRKRQFHQIGVELIQSPDSFEGDKRIVLILDGFLKALNVQNVKIKLNDLSLLNGSEGDQIREKIKAYFALHEDKLDEDSKLRLHKNVLRIFDSKAPQMQELVENFPWEEIAPLSENFKKLVSALQEQGVNCEVNRRLVRGLDYYTGTVFEASSESLGAQDALAGGGRYDRLYSEIGGAQTLCTGFSIGMERLMTVLEKNDPSLNVQLAEESVYFAPVQVNSDEANSHIEEAAFQLGLLGLRVICGKSEKKIVKHFQAAEKALAKYVVILGDEEFKKGHWNLKNIQTGEQEEVPFGELSCHLLKGRKLS